jgi:HPt (histidine-containing phosphotransfer) domain-containing protein
LNAHGSVPDPGGWMLAMYDFTERLRADAKTLARCRDTLEVEPQSTGILNELRACSHKLAGAAGVFGYAAVSAAAAAVEQAVEDRLEGGPRHEVATRLDALLLCIGQESLRADKPPTAYRDV